MSEERKHHPLGPSSLQSIEACPIYQGKQDPVPHERTVAGTRAHDVAETREDDHRLSDEDAEAVADCLDFFESRMQLMQEARARAVRELAGQMSTEPENEHTHPEEFLPAAEAKIPQIES